MLATIGDLVEDVVVRPRGPINRASDTTAVIRRRRGGSAANVASTAAHIGRAARFIGCVGEDPLGSALVGELASDGVDVTHVQRAGRSGTIVVLVGPDGERTMLTDRAACLELGPPDLTWLDEITTLHVPWYSLTGGPLADTTATLIGWAHERGVPVSIDLSSTALIEAIGPQRMFDRLEVLRPQVVVANEHEAAVLGVRGRVAGAITVVKHGPDPVEVFTADGRSVLDVPDVGHVTDTTGAGDAFAAAFLALEPAEVTPLWLRDPVAAARTGVAVAAEHVRRR